LVWDRATLSAIKLWAPDQKIPHSLNATTL
jgi:hypothetical protein